MLAAPVDAATVRFDTRIEGGNKGPDVTILIVTVEAAPGEVNTVTASVASATKLVLSDPAAPLTASTGCTQAAPGIVECPLSNELRAHLGDGNDVFTVDPAFRSRTFQSGGPGDDALSGGGGDDRLSGGGGRDVLTGGAGIDALADDDGDAPDADVLDGGPGLDDAVSFEDGRAGMTLDLPAGRSSEGDAVTGFETIRLGPGADTVTGTAANEYIADAGGANVVDGGAGDDSIYVDGRLSGGEGNDSLNCGQLEGCMLSGGAGNDTLQSGDGDDVLDGGAGDDDLTGLRGDDTMDGGPGDDSLRCGRGRRRRARARSGLGPDRLRRRTRPPAARQA